MNKSTLDQDSEMLLLQIMRDGVGGDAAMIIDAYTVGDNELTFTLDRTISAPNPAEVVLPMQAMKLDGTMADVQSVSYAGDIEIVIEFDGNLGTGEDVYWQLTGATEGIVPPIGGYQSGMARWIWA